MSEVANVPAEAPVVLDAESIGRASDIKTKELKVPEWGGSVWVRDNPALQAVALDEDLNKLKAEGKQREAIWTFLAAVLSKPDGTLLFRDAAQARDVLGKRSPRVLARVQREAMEFLGMEVVACLLYTSDAADEFR
ncbi:MAG: hypothetical protein QUU85_10655, partial [Candidatus Eisenbacteria bacterium]|nr:hypothetical protein [Candidatus Eisenbacteria bacterium]